MNKKQKVTPEDILSLVEANKESANTKKWIIELESSKKINKLNNILKKIEKINEKDSISLEDGLFLVKNILSPENPERSGRYEIQRFFENFKFDIFESDFENTDMKNISECCFVEYNIKDNYSIKLNTSIQAENPVFYFSNKIDNKNKNNVRVDNFGYDIEMLLLAKLSDIRTCLKEYLENKKRCEKTMLFKRKYIKKMDGLKEIIKNHYDNIEVVLKEAELDLSKRKESLTKIKKNNKTFILALNNVGFKVEYRNFSYWDLSKTVDVFSLQSVESGITLEGSRLKKIQESKSEIEKKIKEILDLEE